MIADQFLESSLWDLLWSRVSQSLKPNREVTSATSDAANQDENNKQAETIQEPDWVLISPNGLVSVMQLTSKMLTMVKSI